VFYSSQVGIPGMIRVENLVRCYGSTAAVNNVSFAIESAQVVGLLGHNGSGKTTIMKMLTGFLEPTAGRIEIGGMEIGADTRSIQALIGYLPENCPLWPDMRVVEFLDYQACLRRIPPADRDPAIEQALKRTGLEERATETIRVLSRGYRQRLGVAQAILHEPSIVILDEPTNGLDPTQILQMRSLIRDLAKQSTVLISTHVLQEVQAICERVLILRAGDLVLDATIADLAQGKRLLVTVNADATDVLTGVRGVEAIEELSTTNNLFRYAIDLSYDCAPEIAAAVQAAGLNLHLLQPEQRNLESVFAAVNEPQTEQAP